MLGFKIKTLTDKEEFVIAHKGTEAPYSGEYNDFYKDGVYKCKRCDEILFSSKDKFSSGCG
jgi:peptide methionine sulfoxide reductase MsrB